MKRWVVYDVRIPGAKQSRDWGPFEGYIVPEKFEVKLKEQTYGCCVEWLWLTFENRKVVYQDRHTSGCPLHEGRDLKPLPEDEIREIEKKVIEYLEGKRKKNLMPNDEILIGFYTDHNACFNKYPQKGIRFKNGKCIEVFKSPKWLDSFYDDTIWCGDCVYITDFCKFAAYGEGIPPCIKDKINQF